MIKGALAVAGILLAGMTSVQAGESAIPITPPGGTDLSQALLPAPGLYGSVSALAFNRSEQTFNSNGNLVSPVVKFRESPIGAFALAYIYPQDLWGGKLATTFVLPVEQLCYDIYTINNHACVQGIGDVYSDLLIWSRKLGLFGVTPGSRPLPYGLTFAAGMSMKAPTGKYDPRAAINAGSGSYVAVPNMALTYVTGPNMSLGGDSTEISARLFYGVPFTNPNALGAFAAGYTSGNLINVDWSATERYGNFRFGIAGSYETQVSNDTLGTGIPRVGGNRFNLLELGPIVEYQLPWGVTAKAKYIQIVAAHNNTNEQYVYVSFSKKVF